MSSYYRVYSDRQVEELRNTVDDDEKVGNFINILKEKLKINIISLDEETVVFDLIGTIIITIYHRLHYPYVFNKVLMYL